MVHAVRAAMQSLKKTGTDFSSAQGMVPKAFFEVMGTCTTILRLHETPYWLGSLKVWTKLLLWTLERGVPLSKLYNLWYLLHNLDIQKLESAGPSQLIFGWSTTACRRPILDQSRYGCVATWLEREWHPDNAVFRHHSRVQQAAAVLWSARSLERKVVIGQRCQEGAWLLGHDPVSDACSLFPWMWALEAPNTNPTPLSLARG